MTTRAPESTGFTLTRLSESLRRRLTVLRHGACRQHSSCSRKPSQSGWHLCDGTAHFVDVCEVITLLLLFLLVRAVCAYTCAIVSVNRITSVIRLSLNSCQCDAGRSSTEVGTRLEVIVLWVGRQVIRPSARLISSIRIWR